MQQLESWHLNFNYASKKQQPIKNAEQEAFVLTAVMKNKMWFWMLDTLWLSLEVRQQNIPRVNL